MTRAVSLFAALLLACGSDASPTTSADAGGDVGTTADTFAASDVGTDDTGAAGDATAPDLGADTGPLCTSSADCGNATIKIGTPIDEATLCAHGHCGLATPDNRPAGGTKSAQTCDAICAAATYAGAPMACSPLCRTVKTSGFGDLSLAYDDPPTDGGTDAGDAGPPVGALVRYVFGDPTGLHSNHYLIRGCSELPPKTYAFSGSSSKYEAQHCCCIATKS